MSVEKCRCNHLPQACVCTTTAMSTLVAIEPNETFSVYINFLCTQIDERERCSNVQAPTMNFANKAGI